MENKKVSYVEINIPCEKKIWTTNLKLEIEETISENMEVKKEIGNMKELIDEQIMFTNINDALKSFGKSKEYSDNTINYAISELNKL